MKRNILISILIITTTLLNAQNSKFISTTATIMTKDGYKQYSIFAFRDNIAGGNNTMTTIRLLPILGVANNFVRYYDKNYKLLLGEFNPNDVSMIKIPVTYIKQDSTIFGPFLIAQINGKQFNNGIEPILPIGFAYHDKYNSVVPEKILKYYQQLAINMRAAANNNLQSTDHFLAMQQALEREVRAQDILNYLDNKIESKKTKFDEVVLNNLGVSLLINGIEVQSLMLNNSGLINSGDSPFEFVLRNPNMEIVSSIIQNDYKIIASYYFNDTQASSISARFDSNKIYQSLIDATKSVITKSKTNSRGIFIWKSTKSTIEQIINESLINQSEIRSTQDTEIIINDASDSMIKRFQDNFFPETTKADVINSHIHAANEAEASGNLDLAKVHRDYVNTIQQAPAAKSEMDVIGAAAALGEGNYLMFLAKGIKISDDTVAQNYSYHKINKIEAQSKEERKWNELQTVTIQRKCSQILVPQKMYKEQFGFDGMILYQDQWMANNNVPPILSGFLDWSPFSNSITSIPIGSYLYSYNGQLISTISDVVEIRRGLRAGDRIEITLAIPGRPDFTPPSGKIIKKGWGVFPISQNNLPGENPKLYGPFYQRRFILTLLPLSPVKDLATKRIQAYTENQYGVSGDFGTADSNIN